LKTQYTFSTEELLIDKAQMMTLTAPEMTVLVGGMRVMGANFDGSKHGVFTNKVGTCLLEEGHCMRNQVLELCDFHKKELNNKLNFRYKAGSIDSLLRFVKANKATTLLPFLAAKELSAPEQKKISEFRAPIPFRSVGIVTHSHFVKHKIRELLEEEILREVKPLLQKTTIKGKRLLPMS
jgi:hypothetical protein